ncbi:hypothetical protein AAZX31_06G088800 [Glycine max]
MSKEPLDVHRANLVTNLSFCTEPVQTSSKKKFGDVWLLQRM